MPKKLIPLPKLKNPKGSVVACNYCGTEFYLSKSRLGLRANSVTYNKYCSKACHSKSLKTNKERVCKNCGKTYYVSKSQVLYRNIQCCSNECRYAQYKLRWNKNWQQHRKNMKKEGMLPRHLYNRHLKPSKEKDTRSLIKKLDKIFSLHIRKKYAVEGMVQCFTCMVVKPYTEMDAGHYISRRYLFYRFDERNVKPQCRKCNRFQNGNLDVFAIRLMNEYGVDLLREFDSNKATIVTNRFEFITKLIQKYS